MRDTLSDQPAVRPSSTSCRSVFLYIKTGAKVNILIQSPAAAPKIYSYIENLVLWAGSEKTGCAAEKCCGKMEYWNVGILGLAEGDLFFYRGH